MGYWQIHCIRKGLPGIFLRFALDLLLPAANLEGKLLGCGLRRISRSTVPMSTIPVDSPLAESAPSESRPCG